MGANFVTTSCIGTKEDVQKHYEEARERDLYENGHSYSGGLGMTPGLSFDTYEAPNADEATLWLDKHCNKWDNAVAIRIKGTNQWVIGGVCSS